MTSSRAACCGLVLAGLAAPAPASAADVLFLGERSPISDALGFELAPRGVTMELDAPLPASADRAALAGVVARARGARVAVWIEASAVVALRVGERAPREAPLPPSLEPARMVAMIAASLIDEALAGDDAARAEPASREVRAGAGLDSPASVLERAATSAAVAGPHDDDTDRPPPIFSPFVAMTVLIVGARSDGLPVGGTHSLELGFSFERTLRIAAQLIFPLLVPEAGTGAGGGGLSLSARGDVGEVELRGGVGIALLLRGAPNPSAAESPSTQPGTLLELGGVVEIHGRIGARLTRTCALLGGVALHGVALEGAAGHGSISATFTMEWF